MPAPTRKIGKRACDACKIRKVKCSGTAPCAGCASVGVPCTFNKHPLTRGPRNLRAKTIRQITETQQAAENNQRTNSESPQNRRDETPIRNGSDAPSPNDEPFPHPEVRSQFRLTSTSSLVLRLCVYRLRLFPVWPIIDVEEIMGSLHRDPDNMDAYALANAVGAATIAQLKLDSIEDGDMATAASMESECRRALSLLRKDGQEPPMNINSLRVSFFLHVYHENRSPGGPSSLLYLREAISMAQIMGLHREATYASLTTREQQMRQRILSLLFVTERGVAMLHKLPVVLRYNIRFINLDDAYDETHVLPAFKKLVNLFWMFDQSGAFDILHSSDEIQFPPNENMQALNRSCLSLLQRQLQEVSVQSGQSNDIQTADICVTRQWMQAVLWRASRSRGSTPHSSQQATSLSHPIQIAKEFLETISKLPSSAVEAHGPAMEYKIYEIAKAVTDSVMANLNTQILSLDSPTDILFQLQSKLASCRGGNKTLLPLLHARISEALSGGRMLLAMHPSLRVQELSDSDFSSAQPSREPLQSLNDRPMGSQISQAQSRSSGEHAGQQNTQGMSEDGSDTISTLLGATWDHNIPDALLSSNQDLFNQAQDFQGSFNHVESTGTMELLMANSNLWDSVESWNSQFVEEIVSEGASRSP